MTSALPPKATARLPGEFEVYHLVEGKYRQLPPQRIGFYKSHKKWYALRHPRADGGQRRYVGGDGGVSFDLVNSVRVRPSAMTINAKKGGRGGTPWREDIDGDFPRQSSRTRRELIRELRKLWKQRRRHLDQLNTIRENKKGDGNYSAGAAFIPSSMINEANYWIDRTGVFGRQLRGYLTGRRGRRLKSREREKWSQTEEAFAKADELLLFMQLRANQIDHDLKKDRLQCADGEQINFLSGTCWRPVREEDGYETSSGPSRARSPSATKTRQPSSTSTARRPIPMLPGVTFRPSEDEEGWFGADGEGSERPPPATSSKTKSKSNSGVIIGIALGTVAVAVAGAAAWVVLPRRGE